jgi:glucose-6-phosphate isomerase, archaeal
MNNMSSFMPLDLNFSTDPLDFEPKGEIITRTLSSMKDAFVDQEAAEIMLSHNQNPLIVKVFMANIPAEEGFLMVNINAVYPGKVGNEFFMTKGHIHNDPEHAPEVYITLRGNGKLVLQTKDGNFHISDMTPNKINFIPAPWAHRCVNVGDEPLIYLGVFPSDTERDYSFDSRAFKKIIIEQAGKIAVIDNPLLK